METTAATQGLTQIVSVGPTDHSEKNSELRSVVFTNVRYPNSKVLDSDQLSTRAELPLAQSTVSQHLKILKESGMIQGEIDGPKVCYCINAEKLDALKKLIAAL